MSLKELSFSCPIDQIDLAFVINRLINVERIHINDNIIVIPSFFTDYLLFCWIKTYYCGDQTIGWLRCSVALKTDRNNLVVVRKIPIHLDEETFSA